VVDESKGFDLKLRTFAKQIHFHGSPFNLGVLYSASVFNRNSLGHLLNVFLLGGHTVLPDIVILF